MLNRKEEAMLIPNDLGGITLLHSSQGFQENQPNKVPVLNRQDSLAGKLANSRATETPGNLNSFDQTLARLREDEVRGKQGRGDEQLDAILPFLFGNQPLNVNQAPRDAVSKDTEPQELNTREFAQISPQGQSEAILKQRLQLAGLLKTSEPTVGNDDSKLEKVGIEQSFNLRDLQKNVSQKNIPQRNLLQESKFQDNVIQDNLVQNNIIQENALKKNIFQNNLSGGENSLTQNALSPLFKQQDTSENIGIAELPSEGKNFISKWGTPKKATTAFLGEGAGHGSPIAGDNFFPQGGSPISAQHPIFPQNLPTAPFTVSNLNRSDRTEENPFTQRLQKTGSPTGESPQAVYPFLTSENTNSMPETAEVTAQVTTGANAKDRLSSDSLMKISAEVKQLSSNGGGVMKVRLKPEGMGELSMRIVTDGHRVGLKIETSHEKTKQMIEESIKYLGESLSTHQLVLGSVDLSVMPSEIKQFSPNLNDRQDSQDSQRFDLNMSQNKTDFADSGNRGEGQRRSSPQLRDNWEVGLPNRRPIGVPSGIAARFSPDARVGQPGRIDMRV